MSPDKEAELRRLFPLVYGGPFLNGEGFRCGDGWYDLLYDLGYELTAEIAEQPEDERHQYRAEQVKQKFGGLRVYLHRRQTPGMGDAIAKAEARAWKTCEICGQPGTMQTHAYVQTLCEEHAREKRDCTFPR